jgi:gluconolactonase
MTHPITEASKALVDAGLLAADAELESIGSGFAYTEGPVWIPLDRKLLFHDIVQDTRFAWTEDGGVVVESTPTGASNGMTLHWDGGLLICEAGKNQVVRHEPHGAVGVIASHYDGKELNSPNDITVRSNGDVYFTDPAYGRIPVYGIERPQQLPYQGIYRIPLFGGDLEMVSDELIQPNGLAFSPDESVLYVADCETGKLWAFDVAVDGSLSNSRIFFEDAGVPCPWEDALTDNLPSGYLDGTTVDERGNVYQTGKGGIWVISPEGEAIGVLELPEDVANLTFGGDDYRTLFLACRNNVYRVQMDVAAAQQPQ